MFVYKAMSMNLGDIIDNVLIVKQVSFPVFVLHAGSSRHLWIVVVTLIEICPLLSPGLHRDQEVKSVSRRTTIELVPIYSPMSGIIIYSQWSPNERPLKVSCVRKALISFLITSFTGHCFFESPSHLATIQLLAASRIRLSLSNAFGGVEAGLKLFHILCLLRGEPNISKAFKFKVPCFSHTCCQEQHHRGGGDQYCSSCWLSSNWPTCSPDPIKLVKRGKQTKINLISEGD